MLIAARKLELLFNIVAAHDPELYVIFKNRSLMRFADLFYLKRVTQYEMELFADAEVDRVCSDIRDHDHPKTASILSRFKDITDKLLEPCPECGEDRQLLEHAAPLADGHTDTVLICSCTLIDTDTVFCRSCDQECLIGHPVELIINEGDTAHGTSDNTSSCCNASLYTYNEVGQRRLYLRAV